MTLLFALLMPLSAVGLPATTPPATPSAPPSGAQAEPSPASPGETVLLRVPVFSERFAAVPVAAVDGDVIVLREVVEVVALAHEDRKAPATAVRMAVRPVLERLITARLIAAEAREMGLAEEPEAVAALNEYKANLARETVKAKATAGLKPDQKEVERRYREASRAYEIRTVTFAKQEDAKEAVAAIRGGKSFDAVVTEALEKKSATGNPEPLVLSKKELFPAVRAAVESLKRGAVSDPLPVNNGFAILVVVGTRQVEDQKVRAQIEDEVWQGQTEAAREKQYRALRKKYAEVDETLLKKVDLEAPEPGLAALAEDGRVLARIRGSKLTVTVGDIVGEIQRRYFHGAEKQAGKGKLNAAKDSTFDTMLYRRLLQREAEAQKVASTEQYRARVKDFEVSYLFSQFAQRVLIPDAAPTDAETRAYHDEHKAEFTEPAMVRLRGTAFQDAKVAEAVIVKLRAGTDFKWILANAEGQVDPANRSVEFSAAPVIVTSLPGDMGKALAGAKSGDVRLWQSPEGQAYVVEVVEQIPARTQPYEEAKQAAANKAARVKLDRLIADWAAKLRSAHQVVNYIADSQ